LVSFLLSRFPHLLVHGLRVDAFDTEMVAALSRGRLQSVDAIDGERPVYVIAKKWQRFRSQGPRPALPNHSPAQA